MVLFRARSSLPIGIAAIAVLGVLPAVVTTNAPVAAQAAGDPPVMTMYVPLAEQEISDGLFSIYPAGAASAADIVSTISLTSAADDSIIYWDHWEDGYEADLTSPTSPTTQVWGDQDLSNGAAPNVSAAVDDVIDLGTVVFLQDTVELPRSNGQVFYDGGDKVAASRGFSMTRAGWDSGIGAAHAGAVAATDTSKFGLRFDVPLGEDAGFGAFDYTGLSVLVTGDDTTINVDLDGDGTIDQTANRDEGGTFYLDGGVTVGTVVTTSSPAQVHLITGRRGSRYEGRWYEVFPAETVSDEYVAAAGSFSATQLVTIFLYNPNDAQIDVAATTSGGTTVVPVPAGEVVAFDLPNGSGGRFSSPGNQFSAVSGTVAQTGATVAYDWGYSLVPTSLLTPTVFVGWGAGNPGNSASNSPVWVAPLGDTTIHIDRDADGTPDESIAANEFESVRVVDPDHDLTGARIFTTDGTPLSVAWGQDAAIQPSNAYDLGTAVLPTAALITTKTAALTDDVNSDGLVDPGDELTYSIEMFDAGALSVTGLVVTDDLPPTLEYVPDSTVFNGTPVNDAITGTPNPLDESGLPVTDLDPGDASLLTFRVRLIVDFPFDVDQVTNTASVVGVQASSASTAITAVTPISPATIAGEVWTDVDGDGVLDVDETGFSGIAVTITGPSHPSGTTAPTGASGYSFGDLLPGTYTIEVDRSPTSPLPAGAYSSTGGDTRQITVASGEQLDENDFGYVFPGSVAGTVFHDVDADDVFDATETGFAGVDVTITGPGLPPAGLTHQTSPAGTFVFSGLGAGTFTVSATPATGSLPAQFERTGGPRTVTIAVDAHSTNNDLGFHDPVPLAVDDDYTTEIGIPLTVSDIGLGVLANDTPGNDPTTVTAADSTTSAGGTVSVSGDGTFTYTPPAGFTGVDSFDYTITDASGDESTATVRINVLPPASITGRVWHDRNANGAIDPGEAIFADLVVERRACSGATLETATTDENGWFEFDGLLSGCHEIAVPEPSPDAPTPTFDRDGGYDGTSEIVVVGGQAVSDADFGFVNLVPDAGSDRVDANEGESVTFDPLENDADPEGRDLVITFVTTSDAGAVSTDGSSITYTPAPGFDGTETVVYTVCDPAGECSTAAAVISVANTNDPPRIANGRSGITIIIGQPIAPLDVIDDEGDPFTVELVGGQLPAGVTLNSDGTFSGVATAAGTPPGSTTSFDVELCDAQGACATVTLTMTAQAASGGNSIPRSGTETMRLVPSALGLLLLGAMLTLGGRRRTPRPSGAS